MDCTVVRHGGGTADLLRLQLGPLRESVRLRPTGNIRLADRSIRDRWTVDLAGPRTALVQPGDYRRGGGAGRDLQAMGRQVDCGRGRRLPGRAFDLDVVGGRMVVGATAAAAGNAGVDGARWASRAAAALA